MIKRPISEQDQWIVDTSNAVTGIAPAGTGKETTLVSATTDAVTGGRIFSSGNAGIFEIASQTVDINAAYGVKPGDDVTAALQAAINTLVQGATLDIVFSIPGIYYINGAQKTGTALSYAYSGSILIPAISWDGGSATVLRIRGGPPNNTGDPSTADANTGVVLKTTNNVSGGYMFAAVPYSSKWGAPWTGVVPHFENLTFYHPTDPQGGAINVECCIRASLTRIICNQGSLSGAAFPTGTTEAIILPGHFNNGDVAVRNVQVRGWGIAMRVSEHAVLDNVDISYCGVAFAFYQGGHPIWFGYVDVEECATIFKVVASGYVVIVNGSLDVENVQSGNSFAPTVFADVAASSGLHGNLDLTCQGSVQGGLGLKGSGVVKMMLNNTIDARKYSNPIDTMVRLQGTALPAGSAPGLSWPTLDAWRVLSGNFALSADGSLTNSNGGSSSAYLPVSDGLVGGNARRVQCTITLPASSYDFSLVAHRQQSGTLACWARVSGGNLTLGIGSVPGGGLIKTIGSAVSGSGTYTLAIDVFISNGLLVRADFYLNAVLQYSHACTSAQQYTNSASDPYLYDGIYIVDNGGNVTSMTAFSVRPLIPAPASMTSGTATLVGGTIDVTNTSITASSIIRLTRQATGGTPGHLSIVLSAGVKFTINSSSGTDTSTIFWEIVSV